MKTFTNLIKRASLSTFNKKRYYLFVIMLLTLGIGSAWGADVVCDFTTKSASGSSYTTTWNYGDFTIFGGANNNKGWAFVKMGGKSTNLESANPVYISSKQITSSISKVQVSVIAGSLAKSGMKVNSWGVYVYSDANMTNQVDYVAGGTITNNAAVFELTPTSGSAWSANNYYKVSFDLANTTTTNGIIWLDKITFVEATETPDPGTPPATTYTVTIDPNIENGTVTASPTEAAEGATVTLIATPSTNYNFGSWTVKDASDADVAVTGNTFTMPASNVTVSASFVEKAQYTIKWNVAEGTVEDTKVYKGDALGTLPTADNCSSGKVFIGWTEATSVNADGSGLVLAKATDVPAGNKEYNAVYATLSGSADKVDNLDLSLTGASGSTYSSWSGKKSVSDAVYAGNSAGGNDAIQLRKSSDSQAKSGIITTTSGGKAKKVVVTWNSNTVSGRTLNVYGSNSAYSSVDNLYTDATAGTLIGTIVNGTSTELDITGDYEYIGMRSNASAMYLDEIQITWSASSASDYSLDCGTNNTPFLTVTETPIDFGTVAQNATATETLNVSGSYLAEDVTLTITGSSFFSVNPTTIAKADEIDQDVTITYNPTEIGNHTATLTIKSGEITKTVALSGTVLAPGKWALVKNVAELSAGDEIIIASAVADYAIGVAASNNYKGAAITKVGETANTTAEVTILTVEETGVAEAPYAFKTNGKYLYAASSSANQLKAQATNNTNGQWAVAITEGVASIVAAKSSNRNVMQCNPNGGSPIFACYSSASYEALVIYRNSENVAKPVLSGDVDFTGSTQVTITAKSGLTVYYTTDGSTPDKNATQYSTPFTISETTTVKAIAYDASSNASGIAEMTFTKHELVNVATAMALAKDEVAYYDEFEVVKVVTGKGNIYIKDASGHGLIYDNTLAGELKDGDRVQGFIGISAPYNGLPEAKPHNVTYADLTITSGVAAEPYDFTSTAVAEADINKYIVFNDVAITTNTDVSTNPTLTIGGNNVKFYNQFGISKTLEAGKTYDIYGFVAIYNSNLQVYFYQALEEGEVVTKYTVTYNAGGATGEVPVDNNEYTEGAQVYLKSATGLTKEGYDYKGWKVTDEGGNEIAVSSNKFNMPASNVTVTAQWEEIVVPEIQDFSTGYWVLVTDESELQSDDYVVIAAADYDVAMKSYESGNNCKQIAVTKLGNQFIKWTSEMGVFQLAANGSNYTIQDVNTEQYLYAAGGTSSNHLKASDAIPTSEEAQKYVWTITIADRVATVTANVEGRNTIRYNATEGTNGQLFSCYASGQKDIALYKYVDTYTYTRNVTNKFGTICLPYASASTTGAYFYEVAGTEEGKVYLASVNSLEAGVPYIFEATASTIKVTFQGEAVAEAGTANGLIGTFTNETEVPEGAYILYNNAFRTTDDPMNPNKINAYRAYLVMEDIVGGKPTQMPGRRYIGMAVEGENAETGLENIIVPEGQAVKVISNGQLIIIRDGEMYNAQGQKL